MLFEDHLAAVEADSRKWGTQGDAIDFALLVDGLAAEREQLEKERAAFEKQKAKEEEAARKKAEKELERQMLAREKAAEKRKAQIERQLINAGASLLKKGLQRGLMNTLSGTSKRRSR